ncbi:DUF5819 family protein [Streptomyces sp. NBC_00984]|uniref:DUF5819 family protein n=1 Tax=Streptomyces sp. NBC_00984 TaxID=2903700 RepID=UPI003863CE01|nr:DUF5819 family protein [Streptomyces sp. NBC_00984]
MTPTGPGDVLNGGEPVSVKASDAFPPGSPVTVRRTVTGQQGDAQPGPDELSRLPLPLRAATKGAAVLLVCVSLLHMFFLFLHVAPPNQISQRYARQVQSWVYPLFEQNWRLFAPEPESSVPQVSARTVRTTADGSQRISGWFDLTAVDDAEVRHNPFPSHTNQNMLRRAWTGYLESHGNSDESYSDRAVMWQEYLRNIAVDRITATRPGAVDGVQLRVLTRPVAAFDATGQRRPVSPSVVDTRNLPWWKVPAHGH